MKTIETLIKAIQCKGMRYFNAQDVQQLINVTNEKELSDFFIEKYWKFEEEKIKMIDGHYHNQMGHITVKNGYVDGEIILRHKNGKVRMLAQYKKWQLHGNYMEFDSKGQILHNQVWKNGKLVKTLFVDDIVWNR